MNLTRPRLTLLLASALLALGVGSVDAAKRKPRPVVPPDLKILSVTIAPEPYRAGDGALDFTVQIELPDDTVAGTLLDVSALIASPSRRSMRFLANREPVDDAILATGAGDSGKPHVAIVLSWDGTDQSRKVVDPGKFSYEIRAKLLVNGDHGPRTQKSSWPKRGTLDVRQPATASSSSAGR